MWREAEGREHEVWKEAEGREHEVWREAEGGSMRCGGRQREGA